MTVAAPPSRPRADRLYPTLSPAQLERVAAHGRRRQVAQGEVLQSAGEPAARCFVVVAGRIDAVRPSAAEEIVVSLGPGMFTGEATMLSGRPGLAQIRAEADGEVIEIARDDLLALIQTDGELSAIFMRAFILRRVELIAHGFGDVVLIGSNHCAGTLRVNAACSASTFSIDAAPRSASDCSRSCRAISTVSTPGEGSAIAISVIRGVAEGPGGSKAENGRPEQCVASQIRHPS